jgi:hypothetical protein
VTDYGDMKLVNEQMRKAAAFFGNVLEHHRMGKLAASVNGVAIVVARGKAVDALMVLLTEAREGEPFLPVGFSFDQEPKPEPSGNDPEEPGESGDEPQHAGPLIPRYHVPGSQVYPGSRGGQVGNVHLHVTADMTLGRRKRKKGECLCSKRNGSDERPPQGETKMCEECVKVAADNGLAWSLT